MSNGHKLELLRFSVTESVLNYWDSLHGDDVVIVLRGDQAYLQTWEDETAENPTLTPINLAQTLIDLSNRLANEDWRRGNE